jgi:hypothetical protein
LSAAAATANRLAIRPGKALITAGVSMWELWLAMMTAGPFSPSRLSRPSIVNGRQYWRTYLVAVK